MIIKLKKKSVAFRNPQLFDADIKSVNLERLLSNLYLLIATDGAPVTLGAKKLITLDTLKEWMKKLGEEGKISGVLDEKGEVVDAVEDWLRSNLVDLVNRGNMVKENVASLLPMHLMSYRIQNRRFNRDYQASDQVFMMLRQHPEVKEALKKYLGRGWDPQSKSLIKSADLDVDTTAILLLTQKVEDKKKPNSEIKNDKPLLTEQTDKFCEDIRRLLQYQDLLPRNVLIDYLRILIGFHLALYMMKMVYLLPKMRAAGTVGVEDDWSMVVDLNDSLDSPVSFVACQDMEKIINGLSNYLHTTFEINTIQTRLRNKGEDVDIPRVLDELINVDKGAEWFESQIDSILEFVDNDDDLKAINEKLKYFPEKDHFDRYIHLLEMTSGGISYQLKYHRDFIDRAGMKNTSSKLMADGRGKRHPRRGVLGSKLLETLVQILVLEPTGDGKYKSRSFSINELAQAIRDRYGLIINGASEPRFENAGVDVHAAFKQNMEAFKDKLRQIGFYTDLSDACLLQKIRPRYNF